MTRLYSLRLIGNSLGGAAGVAILICLSIMFLFALQNKAASSFMHTISYAYASPAPSTSSNMETLSNPSSNPPNLRSGRRPRFFSARVRPLSGDGRRQDACLHNTHFRTSDAAIVFSKVGRVDLRRSGEGEGPLVKHGVDL